MLYSLCVAAFAVTAGAFTAPVSRAAVSMQMTDFSWRSTYNGKLPGDIGKVVSTAAAPPGEMSVPQACVFMADCPSVPFEEKKAFLLSKGVSEFVIAEAACTASDTTLVL